MSPNMDGKTSEEEKQTDVDEKTPFNEEDGDFPNAHLDSSKVKFVNGGAGCDLELGSKKKKDNDFCGLTKEELLQYADDPFWVKTRWILLIGFWVAWLGMLAAAILIIILAPRCPPRPKLDWWQTSVTYQVYPRSFKDSDGDGIGDLKGIHSKLTDLAETFNASAVWLNPIYPSSNLDFGYDITDYKDVNPEFGTLADFDELCAAIHKQGMHLILDFVPNHTSRNHTWFVNSQRGGDDNQYADYYVWHEGVNNGGAQPDPPNNWRSKVGGSAWTWNVARGAYYYHQYLPEQPDLNLRSAAVRRELESVLLFWLQRKVDGFRVDAAKHLFESENLADEPLANPPVDNEAYRDLSHNATTFQPNTYELVTQWRALLDNFAADEGLKRPKLLMVEAAGAMEKTMAFYEYNGEKGAHMPLNFQLMHVDSTCHARCLHAKIKDWQDALPDNKLWTNWRTGNHDMSRVGTRMGSEAVNAMNMLTMTLRGTHITYYGEEQGMTDVPVSYEDTMDHRAKSAGESGYAALSRDPQRTPMQWSDAEHAGFSNGNHTWLPVADDYRTHNIWTQQAHGSGFTELEVYQDLVALRSEPSMMWGKHHELFVDDNMLVYLRTAEGFDTFLVAINLGEEEVMVNLDRDASMIPPHGYIVASTKNFGARSRDFETGTHMKLKRVKLHPYEGIVVGWPYTAPADAMEQ